MKFILVAGGSGGHIYPCLELAKYLKKEGNEVLLCGGNGSMEERIYLTNNLPFKGLDITKNKFSNYLKNRKKIADIYKQFVPDALILFGNYISVSFAILAIVKNIPFYLHEQNVVYGKANFLLGMRAKRIYLSLPIKNNPYKKKSLLVGNPKSDSLVPFQALDKSKKNIVIVMGSLGSKTINEILKQFIRISSPNYFYHIVVGNKYYQEFTKNLVMKPHIKIYPYLDNLSSYLKSCDLFVSRAGATTISEILSLGVASILIPSPYVKNNHQYKNAKYLLDHEACVLLKEEDLTSERLNKEINYLLENPTKIQSLKTNALNLANTNSKKAIYEDIKRTYER